MDQELQARVQQAAALCNAQIRRRAFRQRNPPILSTRALNEYGPDVIVKSITEVVADLTGSRSLPVTRTDKYWKAFFSVFIHVERVILVTDDSDTYPYHRVSPLFEAYQRPYMRTTLGAGLQVLGYFFRRRSLVDIGQEDGWNACGFQMFYQELLGSFLNPTPLQHEAVVMVARLLTYCTSMLESVSILEQLAPVRSLLNALQTGCIPVAYDKTTGTLFLKNWR